VPIPGVSFSIQFLNSVNAARQPRWYVVSAGSAAKPASVVLLLPEGFQGTLGEKVFCGYAAVLCPHVM
jgi:hypothetical protein